MRIENEKRGEERKQKVTVKTAVSLLNPKPSVHARTLQANSLHLDQKAVGCTTCKWFCGKF